MTTTLGAPALEKTSPPGSPGVRGWFAAFWRWHFFASVLVIPILAVLAVTGLIYLFRFQIEPALHPDLMRISAPAPGQPMAPYDEQLEIVDNALNAEGRDGTVAMMTEPLAATTPTRFTVTLADESTRDYFVDPYRLEVLGSLDPDRTLSGMAVLLHGELMAGKPGAYLMELGACWAIVMALTGYYLFIRGWRTRARAVRQRRRGAPTRQTHAIVGAVAGLALVGLLVSGLPWTELWGTKTQELATANGTSFWSDDHGAISEPGCTLDESLPHSHANKVPWGLGKDQRPDSDLNGYTGSLANLDTAVVVADRAGLPRPHTVVLPEGAEGVFSVIAYAFTDPGDEQTLHVDRYGGQVVSAYGYQQYGALAKTVSHGIALHEGRHFGTLNMLASTLMCLGVLFLCISGPLMWWRRRPRGETRLGAPKAKMPLRTTPLLAVGVVALGVFLPLFGASLLVVLLLDRLVLRRVPSLQRWFDVKT